MADLNPSRTPAAGHWVWRYGACAALLAAAVVLNQSAIHWRENVVDSHLFAYYGWCVADGARPYLNVWDNKPPGIWWVNAAGFALCGKGTAAEVLICTVAISLALLAFVGLAGTVYQRDLLLPAAVCGGLLLTHPLYEGGANRTETFVIAAESLAVLGYARWYRGGRWHWLILAGLAAGAAPLFKQSGLAAGAACALHLAGSQLLRSRMPLVAGQRVPLVACPPVPRRSALAPWLIAGATFAIAPALAAVALWHVGALGEAWRAVGAFNRAYFAIDDATWLRMDRAISIYWETLLPLRWLFAAAGAGLIWYIARHWRRRQSTSPPDPSTSGVMLLWLWFLLAAYLACVGPGRRGHHFLPVLPALGLLALYPLHRLAWPDGLWVRLTRRPTAVAIFVLYGWMLGQFGDGSVVEMQRCWKVKQAWWSADYAKTPDYMQQAAEIRRLTTPDDTVYVWGWSPGTYRYGYRRPASRFATLEKLGQVGQHARFILDGAVADVQREPPRVFVISVGDLTGMHQDDDRSMADWLDQHYVDQGIVGGMHILLRREPR
ncbi:MAG: glycosyltransferase family 39 protein [Phycisphaerae bacterium]|jgi:hypothetical protein